MTERTEIVDVCIRRESDKMFLVVTNRRFGGFTFPGGRVEPGEHPKHAAIRELKEETGLDPFGMVHVGTLERTWRGKPFRVFMYVSGLGEQEPRQVESGSVPYWVERDALFNPPCCVPASYGWLLGMMDW